MLALGVAHKFQPPAMPRCIGFSNNCVPNGEFRCDGGRLGTCVADLQSAGDGIAGCLAPFSLVIKRCVSLRGSGSLREGAYIP